MKFRAVSMRWFGQVAFFITSIMIIAMLSPPAVANHQTSEETTEACVLVGGGNVFVRRPGFVPGPLISGDARVCAKSFGRAPPVAVVNNPPCEFFPNTGLWHCPYDITEGTGGRGGEGGRSSKLCGAEGEPLTCHFPNDIREWGPNTVAYVNEQNWIERSLLGHTHAIGSLCIAFTTTAVSSITETSITTPGIEVYCTVVHV